MKYCPQCQRTYSDTQRFCLEDGSLLSFPDPYHLVGRTLVDRYRIEALVGAGGMGAVYSAHQLGIDRRVAFKILLPHLALGNERVISLFEREAKTAGHLIHENIAIIYDAGRTPEGIAYIAMEWLDGRTLEAALLASGPLSVEQTSAILRQVCAALEAAHAHHIIHRDLKPANMMLVKRPDGTEQVKVLDFGIAKVISETTDSPVSALMGTPHYASPEQFKLGAPIDSRTDIYSLGVVLYQMLTGALPFNAPSIHELIQLQITAPPPPVRQLRPEVPLAIEQLIDRMLAKKPEQRPHPVSEISRLFALALNPPLGEPVETLLDRKPPAIPEQAIEEKSKISSRTALSKPPDSVFSRQGTKIEGPKSTSPPPKQAVLTPPRAGHTKLKLTLIVIFFFVSVGFVALVGFGYVFYRFTSSAGLNNERERPAEALKPSPEVPSKNTPNYLATPLPTIVPSDKAEPAPTPIATPRPLSNTPLPIPKTQAPTYISKCVFYGDPNSYYVTSNNEIVGVNIYRQTVLVGRKIPPTVEGFAWMYSTPAVTYGVDANGVIWNRYTNGVPFMVGYVTNP